MELILASSNLLASLGGRLGYVFSIHFFGGVEGKEEDLCADSSHISFTSCEHRWHAMVGKRPAPYSWHFRPEMPKKEPQKCLRAPPPGTPKSLQEVSGTVWKVFRESPTSVGGVFSDCFRGPGFETFVVAFLAQGPTLLRSAKRRVHRNKTKCEKTEFGQSFLRRMSDQKPQSSLQPCPPLTGVSQALWAWNPERVSKEPPGASSPGVQKVSETVSKQSPESQNRLFRDSGGRRLKCIQCSVGAWKCLRSQHWIQFLDPWMQDFFVQC